MSLDLATATDLSFVISAAFVILWVFVIISTRQPLKDIQTAVERAPRRVLQTNTARHANEEKDPVKVL